MPVNPFALTEGVPTARVGERLVQARRDAGMGRWRASRVAQISRSNLARMERGRMRPPDGTVIALCRTYDVAVSWLVPERSGNEVVVGAGRIEVAGRARVLSGGTGEGEHAVEAVLGSYLAIVRELRGVGAGGVVSLRDEDLVALARSLGDTPSEIEARLVDLMKLSREEARAVRRELLKRRVAVPAAGLLLATAAVTGSLDGASGGAGRAGGGTFAGARAEHAVDQGGAAVGGPSVTLPGEASTGVADVAAPPARVGGSTATPNVSVDSGDDVVIGDAVSFVRDTPPPAAPRVVIPLPAVAETPAADGGAVDDPGAPAAPAESAAPDAPSSDVVVADPGTGAAPGGDTASVDPGTSDTGGSARDDNARGRSATAAPAAGGAGGNGSDTGTNTSGAAANGDASGGAADAAGGNGNASPADGVTGDTTSGGSDAGAGAGDVTGGSANDGGTGNGAGGGNAHGGNPNASANAADGGSNGGAGSESAGAASPSSNGNGASNAHAHR
jgi:transcriptional regulator with XRE-family HTH domain